MKLLTFFFWSVERSTLWNRERNRYKEYGYSQLSSCGDPAIKGTSGIRTSAQSPPISDFCLLSRTLTRGPEGDLGSISTVSRVRSLILPEERRLDAWPVDLVCDVIGKLITYASPISLEVKLVSNFLIYLAQNYIKRSLTHPNDFRNSFFGTFPYILKKILRYISVHGDM